MSQCSREYAEQLDANDPLSLFRTRFSIPADTIYLAGHSLGLMSRDSEECVLRVIGEWRKAGVGGWLQGDSPWFYLADKASSSFCDLIGAGSDEVVVANSTTVNLHQALATLYRPSGNRRKIIIDSLMFPSDRFAITSHLELRGFPVDTHFATVPSRDGFTIAEDDVLDMLDETVAMLIIPSVIYTSGQLLEIERIAAETKRQGLLLGVDCSHSVGVIPHRFDAWGVDFAIWSNYKYLNGGPGVLAGMYLNHRHFRAPGLAGWFSSVKERQFEMAETLVPAADASAMQIGTPNIMGLAALEGALRIVNEAGIHQIREKSLMMTELLMNLADERLTNHGFTCVTPALSRGGHVALMHKDAARISSALKSVGHVVGDYRSPDIIRLAPSPLYNTFTECFDAIARLEEIVTSRAYQRYTSVKDVVY